MGFFDFSVAFSLKMKEPISDSSHSLASTFSGSQMVSLSDYNLSVTFKQKKAASLYIGLSIRRVLADQSFVLPFEYDQASQWIGSFCFLFFDELCQDERVNIPSPGFPTVHPRASLSRGIVLFLTSG